MTHTHSRISPSLSSHTRLATLARSAQTDKNRETYLGHSLNAPVGRWQQGRDINWYNKEKPAAADEDNAVAAAGADAQLEKRRRELEELKRSEEEALAAAL